MNTTRADRLTDDMLAADPMAQFASWMSDATARGIPEPTAMVLATLSASDGGPHARTVLLKDHGQAGFMGSAGNINFFCHAASFQSEAKETSDPVMARQISVRY